MTSSHERHAKRLTRFDRHVGERVRLARRSRGISQSDLGRHVGLTFQQVQKYERGFNRISAGRLYEMSIVLEVEVTFFFEGLEKPNATGIAEQRRPDKATVLFAMISSIKDDRIRNRLIALIGALADDDSSPDDGKGKRKKPH